VAFGYSVVPTGGYTLHMPSSAMDISIVVPVFNEAESLRELHDQLSASCAKQGLDWELILVDDGSTDASWQIISQLASGDSRVKGLRFRRNFGKAAALSAGFRTAAGRLILTMDADLQDDPSEIGRLIAKLDEGYDLVNGWKKKRHDPWHKTIPSKFFNGFVGFLTGVKLHDHNCGLKLMKCEVASEIRLYGERHRFIPVLADARGFRVSELPVNHRPRQHGKSKYGMRRFVRGFLDLLTIKFLTGYGQRPQHLLGGLGLLFFALGALGLTYLAVLWCLMNVFEMLPVEPIGGRPLLLYSLGSLLLGAQGISLGLIAELVVSNAVREPEWSSTANDDVAGEANSSTKRRELAPFADSAYSVSEETPQRAPVRD
jgi:glycosyltransferase involved in cell wall biosynthesis